MNQKTLIAIMAFIIVFSGVVMYSTVKRNRSDSPNQEIIRQQAQGNGEAAQLKIYENKEYRFELKYPDNWKVSNRDTGTYGGMLSLSFRSLENQKLVDQAQAEIDKGGNSAAGDAYFFNNDLEITIFNEKPFPDNDLVNKIIGETTLGGKNVKEYWVGGYGSSYGLVAEHNGVFFKFDVKGCGTDECIKNRELSSDVKQMLNSFKFL